MPDQRVQWTDELVGANHATKTDTVNRLALIEHNNDGSHKAANIYTDLITKRPWVDVRAFGATGDGITDDTDALQDAINWAATYGLNVYAPEGVYKFTRLYFYYHATYNPGWPSAAASAGRLTIFGDGAASEIDKSSGGRRTILESTDSTGPAFDVNGDGISHALNRLKFKDMTVRATNTTQVIKFYKANHFCTIEDVMVYQGGSGDGVWLEDTWVNTWKDVYIYGGGKTVSGKGLIIRSVNLGGGNTVLINVNTKDFDTGWHIGHATYGSGQYLATVTCIGCQSSTTKTYGVLVGHGAGTLNWIGSYIEAAQDGANTGIGMLVKNNANCINLDGSYFGSNDISLQLGTTDGVGAGSSRIVRVWGCQFTNVRYYGIKVYSDGNTLPRSIKHCSFSEASTYTPIGISLQDATQHGLELGPNYFSTGITTQVENLKRADLYFTEANMVVNKRTVATIANGDATPSVAAADAFKTANTAATTITAFDDAYAGKQITVIFGDSNTTVDFTGTTLKGNGGADFTATTGDHMVCIFDGTNWYCNVSNNT